MCFPRSHKLTTTTEYKTLFDDSYKVSQKYLLILFKPNNKPYARLGLIVSKTVAKSAAIRNKIKRVIRESFRFHQEKLIGFDIIVIARQSCDKLSKLKLREGIDQLWERLLVRYQTISS